MSHTLDIQHFVFGTHARENTINISNREPLFRFLWKKMQDKKCNLYRINGVSDHIHLVVNLHPSISKADFIQYLKTSSSQWIRMTGIYPNFRGWCNGYFSESKDPSSLQRTIDYVKNQLSHHLSESYLSEIQRLYNSNGLKWDDRDMM